MSKRLNTVKIQRARRLNRVRTQIRGTSERPRLQVTISNQHVSAQIINDETHSTILTVSTIGKKVDAKSMTEKAVWVGAEVASKAKTAKVSKVVFDRGSRLYHGRIKALAEAAREAGLEF